MEKTLQYEEADHALTFTLDLSMGANQCSGRDAGLSQASPAGGGGEVGAQGGAHAGALDDHVDELRKRTKHLKKTL